MCIACLVGMLWCENRVVVTDVAPCPVRRSFALGSSKLPVNCSNPLQLQSRRRNLVRRSYNEVTKEVSPPAASAHPYKRPHVP